MSELEMRFSMFLDLTIALFLGVNTFFLGVISFISVL